jgi:hypothetical protein
MGFLLGVTYEDPVLESTSIWWFFELFEFLT